MTTYGRSKELVSRCVECDLAEPESLTSLGGSAPGVVDGILSHPNTRGYPLWVPEPSARDQHDPRIDECGNIHNRSIHTLSILSGASNFTVHKHAQKPTQID